VLSSTHVLLHTLTRSCRCRCAALHCTALQAPGVHCVVLLATAVQHACPDAHLDSQLPLPLRCVALHCRHLVSTAWRYLDMHGLINWGVAPAILARPSPQRQETVVVIGAGLAGEGGRLWLADGPTGAQQQQQQQSQLVRPWRS
jgi:hypothetical protein